MICDGICQRQSRAFCLCVLEKTELKVMKEMRLMGPTKLQNSYFILKINNMYNHNANFTHCCQVCLSL